MKFTLSNGEKVAIAEYFIPNVGAQYTVAFENTADRWNLLYLAVHLQFGKDNRPHKAIAEDIHTALEMIIEEGDYLKHSSDSFAIHCIHELPNLLGVKATDDHEASIKVIKNIS